MPDEVDQPRSTYACAAADTETPREPDEPAGGNQPAAADFPEAPRCLLCGRVPMQGPDALLLCEACRESSMHRPFPKFIKAAAVLIAVPVIAAAFSFPGNLSAAIAFHRGQEAEAQAYYGVATEHYGKVVDRFPDSVLAHAREGIAAYRAGLYDIAGSEFDWLDGREIPSQEVLDELNDISAEVERASQQQERDQQSGQEDGQ